MNLNANVSVVRQTNIFDTTTNYIIIITHNREGKEEKHIISIGDKNYEKLHRAIYPDQYTAEEGRPNDDGSTGKSTRKSKTQ